MVVHPPEGHCLCNSQFVYTTMAIARTARRLRALCTTLSSVHAGAPPRSLVDMGGSKGLTGAAAGPALLSRCTFGTHRSAVLSCSGSMTLQDVHSASAIVSAHGSCSADDIPSQCPLCILHTELFKPSHSTLCVYTLDV